jgi:predicted type IV restriction endonuclease
MVGRVSETARATQQACAAASTMAADRILMLLMLLKYNRRYAKTPIAKARITRVTCSLNACHSDSQMEIKCLSRWVF